MVVKLWWKLVMKWNKLGLICKPPKQLGVVSHCYLPTPIVMEDLGVVRVYYSSWDNTQRGKIFYSSFSLNDPTKHIISCSNPVLDIGEPGTFDSDGVAPASVFRHKNKITLFYQGFQRTCYKKVNIVFSGMAISSLFNHFERIGGVPFLDRNYLELCLRSAPFALPISKEKFKIWYTSSSTTWKECKNKTYWDSYPLYDIGYIKSDDLDKHGPSGVGYCCSLRRDNELGVSRPWVIYENGIYKMWFSSRSEEVPYKLGYAESEDGVHWYRFDDSEIGIYSGDRYDDEMICFGAVIDIRKERYMFYNGNSHGKDGILLAKLEQD